MKLLVLSIFMLALMAGESAAQWQPDSAFYTYQVTSFFPIDTNVFVELANVQFRFGDTNALGLIRPSGIWVERDMNHYLYEGGGNITSMARMGPYVFAVDYGAVILTTDLGYHWTGTGKDSAGNWIGVGAALATIGGTVVSTGYRSTDSGKIGTWRKTTNSPNISQMITMGSHVIGGSQYGTWYSTDSGQSWTQTTNYVSGSFAVIDSTLFSAGFNLLRSTDSGASWTSIQNKHDYHCIATDGKSLFAGTGDSGVFLSTDLGRTWHAEDEGLRDIWLTRAANIKVGAICVSDSQVWVNMIIPSDYRWSTFHRPIREMVDTTSGVVEQLPPQDSIDVYPNPTPDRVSILGGGITILGVRVLNVLGQEVPGIEYRVPSTAFTLDLSKAPSGTYFIEIETSKGTMLRKLVKE